VFTRVHDWALIWVRWIHSTSSNPTSYSPKRSSLPNGLHTSGLQTKIYIIRSCITTQNVVALYCKRFVSLLPLTISLDLHACIVDEESDFKSHDWLQYFVCKGHQLEN